MYTVIEILRSSSYSVLYRGTRDSDGRGVVIKVQGMVPRPHELERLQREFAVGTALNVPPVARPLALGSYEGRPALIMEEFQGEPLERMIGEPMETGRFLELASRITAAVAGIHHFGVIHRNLSPASIVVHPSSYAVTIIDYGVATRLPVGADEGSGTSDASPAEGTAEGSTETSTAHISPEQSGRLNHSPDQRSDLYSLGVTLYQMLAGCLPFGADDAWPDVWDPERVPAPPAHLASRVPPLLFDIVFKLLSHEPKDRYQSGDSLHLDLVHCLEQWRAQRFITRFALAGKDAAEQSLAPASVGDREPAIAMKAFSGAIALVDLVPVRQRPSAQAVDRTHSESTAATIERKRTVQCQAVQSAVTEALSDASSMSKAGLQLLRAVCEHLEWEVGELWHMDRDAKLLRLLKHWQVLAQGTAQAQVPVMDAQPYPAGVLAPGHGLPGRVWQKRIAEWVPDLMAAPCDHAPVYGQSSLRGAFAVPLLTGGEVTHVIAFYGREARCPDQAIMNAMAIIGSQVAHFLERKQTERALVASEERFRLLANLSTDWYWEQDRDLRYTLISEGLLHVQSFRPSDILGKTRQELPIDFTSMDETEWAAQQARIEARQPFYNLEYRIYDSQGCPHWFSINGAPLFGADGAFIGYRGTGKDITVRKQAEELTLGQAKILEMIATGASLQTVLDRLISVIAQQSVGMIGSVLLLEDDGVHVRSTIAPSLPASYIDFLNGAAARFNSGSCGAAIYRRERVITRDIEHDPLWDEFRGLALGHGLRACISTPILSQQGKALGAFAMYYGTPHVPTAAELRLADIASHIAGIAIERKRSEERIRHMAHHDELTGLPNRTLLGEHIINAIADARSNGRKVALLFIDLDHFKHINDSLGHQVGDRLLRAASMRLQRCLNVGERLARLGGDEFVHAPAALSERGRAPGSPWRRRVRTDCSGADF
jgi:PAS domain S-box-containing protein